MMNDYNYLLSRTEWQLKRREILLRDGEKCASCGAKSGLQVHHRQYHIYKDTGVRVKPWNYEGKYLITLCHRCHGNGHTHFKVPTYCI